MATGDDFFFDDGGASASTETEACVYEPEYQKEASDGPEDDSNDRTRCRTSVESGIVCR